MVFGFITVNADLADAVEFSYPVGFGQQPYNLGDKAVDLAALLQVRKIFAIGARCNVLFNGALLHGAALEHWLVASATFTLPLQKCPALRAHQPASRDNYVLQN